MMGIIYLTRCLVNGKLYVGLHTKGDKDYLGSGMFLLRAIKKYGKENFARTDLDTFLTLEEGQVKERRWIAALNSKSPHGYNLTDGGEGSLGYHHSETTKAKISTKMSAAGMGNTNCLGYRHTEATRAKMSATMKAKPKPWLRGKRLSDATRAKMSMALMGNTRGKGNKSKVKEKEHGREGEGGHEAGESKHGDCPET